MSPLLSAAVMLALRGTLDLSDTTELRAGNSEVGRFTLDIETTPSARVSLRRPAWELRAAYTPRLSWQPLLRGTPDIWQQGSLGVGWHDRRASLSLSQDVRYGHLSFASLVAAPEPGTSRLGTLAQASGQSDVLSAGTSVLATLAVTRRLRHTLELGATLSGGVGAASRTALPLQTGGRVELGTSYATSRHDDLTGTLSASRAIFSNGRDNSILEAGLSFRHALGRYATATVGGGAAWAVFRGGSAGYFTGAAMFTYRLPGRRGDRLTAHFAARLSPALDIVRGEVDPRVESTGELTWNMTDTVSLRARAGLVRSMPFTGPPALALGLGEGAVSVRLSDRLRLDGGLRGACQSTMSQWVAFLGVTITAPSIRF